MKKRIPIHHILSLNFRREIASTIHNITYRKAHDNAVSNIISKIQPSVNTLYFAINSKL